jgi:hypothetical protein
LDNIYIADWIREKIKTTKTDGIQLWPFLILFFQNNAGENSRLF